MTSGPAFSLPEADSSRCHWITEDLANRMTIFYRSSPNRHLLRGNSVSEAIDAASHCCSFFCLPLFPCLDVWAVRDDRNAVRSGRNEIFLKGAHKPIRHQRLGDW